MSLADRLSTVVPSRANRGCETCKWIDTLSPRDRASFDSWLAEGNSLAQLHEIASAWEDNPLKVSSTGLRHHVKHHKALDES